MNKMQEEYLKIARSACTAFTKKRNEEFITLNSQLRKIVKEMKLCEYREVLEEEIYHYNMTILDSKEKINLVNKEIINKNSFLNKLFRGKQTKQFIHEANDKIASYEATVESTKKYVGIKKEELRNVVNKIKNIGLIKTNDGLKKQTTFNKTEEKEL